MPGRQPCFPPRPPFFHLKFPWFELALLSSFKMNHWCCECGERGGGPVQHSSSPPLHHINTPPPHTNTSSIKISYQDCGPVTVGRRESVKSEQPRCAVCSGCSNFPLVVSFTATAECGRDFKPRWIIYNNQTIATEPRHPPSPGSHISHIRLYEGKFLSLISKVNQDMLWTTVLCVGL